MSLALKTPYVNLKSKKPDFCRAFVLIKYDAQKLMTSKRLFDYNTVFEIVSDFLSDFVCLLA